ncbi:MAG: ABC transporter [Chloroflexi bacterium]|nr:ABC transporter [Chloroflexota bacterium]
MVEASVTLWQKHMLKFIRNPEEPLGMLLQPILWVVLFGVGMRALVGGVAPNVGDYLTFMLPGIITLTALGGAVTSGASLLDERLRGIIKEYLVAPIPRLSILSGNALSTVTKALLQALLILILGWLMGARLNSNILSVLAGLLALGVYTVGFAGIALSVAARVRSNLGYHGLIFLLNLPLLFASNALYPLATLPRWMQFLAWINPTTYVIDSMRLLIYNGSNTFSLGLSAAILVIFAALGMWLAYSSFKNVVST